jgi:hypothetical protein
MSNAGKPPVAAEMSHCQPVFRPGGVTPEPNKVLVNTLVTRGPKTLIDRRVNILLDVYHFLLACPKEVREYMRRSLAEPCMHAEDPLGYRKEDYLNDQL